MMILKFSLLWLLLICAIIIIIPSQIKISRLNLIACQAIFGISVSSKWYLGQAFSQWLYQNIDQVTDIMDPGFKWATQVEGAEPNISNLIVRKGILTLLDRSNPNPPIYGGFGWILNTFEVWTGDLDYLLSKFDELPILRHITITLLSPSLF